MDYETEEQQVEAIKKWWKENRNSIFSSVIVGVLIIGGWRFYNDSQKTHAESASQTYEYVVQSLSKTTDTKDAQLKVNELYASYSDTPYASLAALVLAKKQVQNGELVQAIQQLDWVVNNSTQDELAHIARLRLVRVLLASRQTDKALATITVEYPASFAALYEELKGDIFVTKGDLDQARIAYDKAILSSGAQAGKWLKLKRGDLGSFNTVEPTT